jgi:hypothetical protein
MRALLVLAGLVAAAPVTADVPMWFRTPSDNIHCLIYNPGGPLVLDCELRERNAGPPLLPRPADCDLDWGNRFALSESGGGYMVCHGDTVVQPGSMVLPTVRAPSSALSPATRRARASNAATRRGTASSFPARSSGCSEPPSS